MNASGKISKQMKIDAIEEHFRQQKRGTKVLDNKPITFLDAVIQKYNIDVAKMLYDIKENKRIKAENEAKQDAEEEKQFEISRKIRQNNIVMWKGLTSSQREYIAKQFLANEDVHIKKQIEDDNIRKAKDIRFAYLIVKEHNLTPKDVIFTDDGFEIPKLRVTNCSIRIVNRREYYSIEQYVSCEQIPECFLSPLDRDEKYAYMMRSFHTANLILNHIRIAPNGKKYIPMKRITRRYINAL